MSTDEEKISRLYQQGSNEKPSAQLDKAILKTAHQAVEKTPVAKSPFSGGWPAAASIAAVLIISVILVPLIREQTPPATTGTTDDSEQLRQEQDITGNFNAEKENNKAKKRMAEKSQERGITQTPRKTLSRKQAFTEEETPAPLREKSALPSTLQTRPAPASAGTSTPNAEEQKPELKSESQLLDSYGLTADSVPPVTLTPEKWLKKIQQLIEQNKLDLARQELDSFKTHYPDAEIEPSILNSFKSPLK